jgi:hypothetical protein
MLNVDSQAANMKTTLFCAVMACLFLTTGAGMAQQPCSSTVLVTALDRNTNQPIDGLAANDFHAKSKGREISIRVVAPPPSERRFVFVLDRSGSMTRAGDPRDSHYDPNHLMKLILVDALFAVPKGDSVAFFAFAGQYSHQTEFMQPAKALEASSEILAWKPEGKGDKLRTPLWAGIDSALRMLSPRRPGDLMMIISDGGDNRSSVSEVQVRGKLLSAGVPILAMVLARPNLSTPEEREAQQSLFDLVKATGGTAGVIGTPVPGIDLDAIVQVRPSQLISQLAHQYELELDTPSIQKPEKWELGLKSLEPGRMVKLFYPSFLPTCSTMP